MRCNEAPHRNLTVTLSDQAEALVRQEPGQSAGRRMIHAGSWVGAGQVVSYAVRLGSSLLMTRILAPDAFGLMAIVAVICVILALLSDVGIRPSILKSARGDDPDFLNTAWTVQVFRGGLMAAGTLVIAAVLYTTGTLGWLQAGTTFADPRLPALLAVTAVSPLILGWQSTKLIQLERHFNMKAASLVPLAAQVVTVFVMVGIAFVTRSIWSIVVGGLCGNLAQVLLTHYSLPGERNRFRWEPEALHELVRFGRWVLLSSAISVFALNGDRLVLGALVGADQLGLYSIALNIASMLLAVVSSFIGALALPVFGEALRINRSQLQKSFFRMRRWMDWALVFCAGLLFTTAEPIVHLLYDDRYAQAGELLMALSFGLAFSRVMLAQQVYMVLGQSKYLVIVSAVSVVTLYVALPLSFLAGGLIAAVYAIALREVPAYITVMILNARHGLNDFRHEASVVLLWPVGWACGFVVVQVFRWSRI